MIRIIIIDLLIIAAVLTLDLVSKHYVVEFLSAKSGAYTVIKNTLSFQYSENQGAAFGIFNNNTSLLIVLVSVMCAALTAFAVWHIATKRYRTRGATLLHVALSMIIAGGLGNLIDRIAYGYVRDFIDYTFIYKWTGKHFAICNVADVFLTVGVILLLIYVIFFFGKQELCDKKNVAEAGKTAAESEEHSKDE